ncbi:DUF397 domain-containing protein [Streptomyces sp. NBC_00073]|uniref:DUF397 domain-containing protein n=1 Tax=Streptomyces sp. NBC_00073 TaxID=2975640 RepID=UPI003253B914
MAEHTIPNASEWQGWRKSSYSNTEGGSCVEVLDNHPSGVLVRDSKVPHGPAPVFQMGAWSAFVAVIKASDPPA